MKLTRLADHRYIVEVPEDIVRALGLHDGDDVDIGKRVGTPVDATARKEAVDIIRQLARPLPPGYKFDREEANAR